MTRAIKRSELVTLKGGHTVLADALLVLWDLERRGFRVKPGDGRPCRILVGPTHGLTRRDKAAIREHRDALAQLLTYVDDLVG